MGMERILKIMDPSMKEIGWITKSMVKDKKIGQMGQRIVVIINIITYMVRVSLDKQTVKYTKENGKIT